MKNIDELREELDAIDDKILELLKQRFSLIVQIAEYKKTHDILMMQPMRVEFVLEKSKRLAREYGLSEIFITELYKVIIEEACRMEDTPYPAYELLPSSNPYTQLPVETSRGCRFSCAFCSIPHRRNWRGLSVDHVIKRVRHALQFKGNINRGTRLLFVDDCFTANGERAISVFKKLHRLYGYTEKVFIEARVTDILKNEILQNIPLQMVSSMQIGVECGYNEGLKKIRKGLTVEQLFSALEILKQYHFDKHCFLSFIIGFPWETMEMINKTLDTIELICTKYKIVCNLNWLLLLPSDLWWEKEYFNIHIKEDMFDNLLWYANSDYFFTTHPLISMEDIIQVEKRIGAMQRQGGTVAYRRRIGNEEDYIEPSSYRE